MRHVIPVNVTDDGGWFGGMVKKRNTIEAAIILFSGIIFIKVAVFMLPIIPKIIIFFIMFLLPTIIAIVGINDQSAMEYVMTSIKYRRSRDIIPYLIQTESVVEEESKSLATKLSERMAANKESKEQGKRAKGKIKPKTKKEKKALKAERKANAKDNKRKKKERKQAVKKAKKALRKGEAVNFTPDDY